MVLENLFWTCGLGSARRLVQGQSIAELPEPLFLNNFIANEY